MSRLSCVGVLLALVGCSSSPGGGSSSSSSSTGGSSSSSSTGGPVSIQLLSINDFHGNLEPPTGTNGSIRETTGANVAAGGATHLAALVDGLRALNPNTLLVSAGDLVGATPLVSAAFHDEPTVEAMNLLGLALSGVGNHEFDHGQDELLRLQNGGCHPTQGCTQGQDFTGAQFKFLAANVLTQDGAGPPLFPAYEVHNFDGVQVAFIGMTLEGTGAIVNPAGIGGLRFENEVATANRLVTEIQASGIQAIVILLHEGGYTSGNYDGCDGISGPVVQIAEGLSDAVDVILSGHTHQAYNCVIAGKVVTSAASFGRLVTQVNLVVDPASGDVTSKEAHNLVVLRDQSNADMDTLVQHYRDLTDAQGNRVVGTLTATLSRATPMGSNGLSTMGAVIADAELAATQDAVYGGAQIAITNPGGVRADLAFAASGGESGSGQVRYTELFAVEPFGNTLVVMTLTGEQVRFALEQQIQSDGMGGLTADILQISNGFSYTINTAQPDGSRVAMSSLMLNGSPMTANAHYRVAVNSYLAAGGDGYASFVQGTDRWDVMAQLDALVAYFENHSPVSPPALDRIHAQ